MLLKPSLMGISMLVSNKLCLMEDLVEPLLLILLVILLLMIRMETILVAPKCHIGKYKHDGLFVRLILSPL
jgi:hypothetical protein